MRRVLERIYSTHRYSNLVDKDRARMVYSMASLMLVMLLIFMTITRNAQGLNTWQQLGNGGTTILYVVMFAAFCTASLMLTRIGRLNLGSMALILTWLFTLGITTVQGGMYSLTGPFVFVIIILLGGLLLGVRGLAGGIALTLVCVAVGMSARATVPRPETVNTAGDVVTYLIGTVLVGGFTYLFLRYARLSRWEGTTSIQQERLLLAEITSQVTQRILRRASLKDVLNNTVDQINASYPQIYHVQVFLIDDKRMSAKLAASTGEVGRILLERQHSLPVGSLSVIGQVSVQGQPIIARASAGEGVHRRNEFLPDTVVEAAFPLRTGDMIIGALDMQSKDADAFRNEDIPLFQSLADNIAIAIDNARLFEDAERRLQENERLVEQTRRAAEEVERLNQQLTGHFWQEYLGGQKEALGLSIDFLQRHHKSEDEWTPTLRAAVENNHLIQENANGGRLIAVPLRVRGQVIGAMEFEMDENGNLSPEDLNLIEEVGEQLGLAAETNRLFETSQRVAQREALVNEIATRLQASNNVEMTLNEAARSLRSTLKAQKVAIRLGTPPAANGSNGGNGKHKEGGA